MQLALLLACGTPAVYGDGTFTLISEAEFSRAAEKDFVHKSLIFPHPKAPVIEVVQPNLKRSAFVPIDIELRFKPAEGETIDPRSFRIYYAWFKLDITRRVLKVAAVTPRGISVKNAEVPPGRHRIFVEISDTSGNLGQRSILIEAIDRGH